MNGKYNILWIDDEWEKMTSFKKYCLLQYQMELHPFKTQKEGLDEYAHNPSFWDAAILDAKVLDENLHETPDVSNLQKAVLRIKEEFKDLQYFISTGQPDLISDAMFKSFFPVYYEKVTDDEKLCNDIIRSIEESPIRKIKERYSDIFSWVEPPIYEEMLSILQIVENGEKTNADVFNKVRKILDWIMTELNTYGILTIEFNGSNLSECSRFLASNDLQDYIPQYIQRQIHSCSAIANEGSHRRISDEDVKSGKAPYLIRSTVFELLNILIWMHQLPSDDAIRRKITEIALNISSKIKQEEPGSSEVPQEPEHDEELDVWHCGDCMLGIKFWKGGKVLITEKSANQSKNPVIKSKYPYFAKYKTIK
jgi:hypothetical protein